MMQWEQGREQGAGPQQGSQGRRRSPAGADEEALTIMPAFLEKLGLLLSPAN